MTKVRFTLELRLSLYTQMRDFRNKNIRFWSRFQSNPDPELFCACRGERSRIPKPVSTGVENESKKFWLDQRACVVRPRQPDFGYAGAEFPRAYARIPKPRKRWGREWLPEILKLESNWPRPLTRLGLETVNTYSVKTVTEDASFQSAPGFLAAYCFSCELGLRANSPGRSGGGGGKRKESTSLQLFLWNSNICIEKVDAKCWLAEMT